MRFQGIRTASILGSCIAAIAAASPAWAEEAAEAADADAGTIIVTGTRATYNNSAATSDMIVQQSPITSVLGVVDTLPGVQVQEGDAFGFDDWSTTVSIRGFQTNLETQQIGITVDGLPNGGSGYGGGSKANRFIDSMNLRTVEVSQGTADIGSLSNEALGGTLNFVTDDPIDEMRVRLSGSAGDFESTRYYGRIDTGLVLGGLAKAWFSYSHQEATDWIGGAAQNHRDNFAGKFIIDTPVRITGYASYDDTHEDNYDQVYSAAQYAANPHTDGLTTNWTGNPVADQQYRRVWSTLRKNFFGYLKADTSIADAIDLHASVYYHDMAGRGDWAPPYIVDVVNDGAGKPNTEIAGARVNGTPAWWATLNPETDTIPPRYTYVDASGVRTDVTTGATAVQSYRHTHYRKDRLGGAFDGSWNAQFGVVENTLRGGIWYEDTNRQEWRDWHKVTDTTVGPAYDAAPYWTQYNRKYPQDTFKWYVEDTVTYGPVTANFGAKQFTNTVERVDLFGESDRSRFKSTSDVLLSGGIQIEPITGLNLFGGYAENFKALTDAVLEFGDADLSQLSPETSENWEAGVRYESRLFNASATWFKAKFSNQVVFVSNSSEGGIDYLGEGDGKFFNAGGIDSEGFELLANVRPMPGLSLYGAYTYIDAKYRGISDLDAGTDDDAEQVAMLNALRGKRVAGVPKHMWTLSASYEYGPVRVGVSGKYTGDRFVNTGNTWTARNYFLTDLNVAVKGEALSDWLKALEFSLTVNNLTDEDYLGGISGNYAWIGAPRTTVFTVTAEF